jgi:simple sugar transport system ATP-binding protein
VQAIKAGDVVLDGVSVARRREDAQMATALGYIPESPRSNGVVESLDLEMNLELRELAAGTAARHDAKAVLVRFDVRPPDPRRQAGTLSGGNLQKLVIARELSVQRPAFLACYPTMGLDLNAAAAVYADLQAQAAGGAAVLWISEDLDDLLSIAHRIAVLRSGELVAVLDNHGSLTRDQVGALMTGSRAA